MDRRVEDWKKRMNALGGAQRLVLVAGLLLLGFVAIGSTPPRANMLILRGIASMDAPRGQLDDRSALEYARRLGYAGEVLDVAANPSQVEMAIERIRRDRWVKAIYGFSGGGYNARQVWSELAPHERQRIGKIVVVGSPGVTEASFPGGADVVVKDDPPEGHMAGPKALLQALE